MFCQMCGTQVGHGLRYCGTCGAQLAGSSATWGVQSRSAVQAMQAPSPAQGRSQSHATQRAYAPQAHVVQPAYAPQAVVAQPQPVRTAPRIRVNMLRVALMSVMGVILSVLIGTIICAGAAHALGSDKAADPVAQAQASTPVSPAQESAPTFAEPAAEPDATGQTTPVAIDVVAAGLDSQGSRVPVEVQGTTDDGKPVNMSTYCTYNGRGIYLQPGTYRVRPAGSPVSSSGQLYRTCNEWVALKYDGNAHEYKTLNAWVMKPMNPSEVTDSYFDQAIRLLKADPERAELASWLEEAARLWREARQAYGQGGEEGVLGVTAWLLQQMG